MTDQPHAGAAGAPGTATPPPSPLPSPAETAARVARLIANLERVIVGKREAVKLVLVGLLAHGHVLIEDVPGVGKTTLARALARSLACVFRRLQFTPDLLPSDILGVSVYEPERKGFAFHPGPIFANVILADEINRATPRTQSALLEAMNDFQVSVDGQTYALPEPFLVLATENPIEHAGTYPLPEAQLDRFLIRLEIGYPAPADELVILARQKLSHPLEALAPVLSTAEVLGLQAAVRQVRLDEALAGYIVELAQRTRDPKRLPLGVSPRGCLMLYRAAQALALIEGRQYVLPDDIKQLVVPVLAHRLFERSLAGNDSRRAVEVLEEILDEVPVPV